VCSSCCSAVAARVFLLCVFGQLLRFLLCGFGGPVCFCFLSWLSMLRLFFGAVLMCFCFGPVWSLELFSFVWSCSRWAVALLVFLGSFGGEAGVCLLHESIL
jgi:hypothetical protein